MSALLHTLTIVFAGGVAGVLGALLGLGGGIFLVPFLNIVLGLTFRQAVAISLMTVIATSSAVSAGTAGRHLMNLRLGMLLEVATAAGGLAGGLTTEYIPERTLQITFAIVDSGVEPGLLGGRFHEDESGGTVVYQVKRLPLALLASLLAGNVSSLLGVGGGIIKVPVLNAWCGVPLRAAAATSAFMIGVTAVSAVPLYYARGQIVETVAAAAVIGVLFGSRVGFWLGGRWKAKWLKALMAAVLAIVSLSYFLK
jgi:uncharacterized membrane protein YfcA